MVSERTARTFAWTLGTPIESATLAASTQMSAFGMAAGAAHARANLGGDGQNVRDSFLDTV